ncbi:MAG: DedA family protein [Candidatus Iainarchaeum archaeon]|uniref:DedA family protein n=1 Tax=Candidatus Iainarchaeum sp. TaxID=3101447 RepID=A0A7T9DJE0_9ARCH|nr:MAG: DedA family protein [Candidatus Diapherotrites archaeon]
MVVEVLADYFVQLIESFGYLGIFILMVLESMIAPVPSELVMPFAGYVAALGRLDFLLVNVAALLGSLVGSFISYAAGKFLGRDIILRYGKYIGLSKRHLEWTEKWFAAHGSSTVLIGRFIPVVRHLISIPAGLSKMPKRAFVTMTLIGAALWNGFLAAAGFMLKDQYGLIAEYSSTLDILVGLALLAGIAYWFVYRNKKSNRQ